MEVGADDVGAFGAAKLNVEAAGFGASDDVAAVDAEPDAGAEEVDGLAENPKLNLGTAGALVEAPPALMVAFENGAAFCASPVLLSAAEVGAGVLGLPNPKENGDVPADWAEEPAAAEEG